MGAPRAGTPQLVWTPSPRPIWPPSSPRVSCRSPYPPPHPDYAGPARPRQESACRSAGTLRTGGQYADIHDLERISTRQVVGEDDEVHSSPPRGRRYHEGLPPELVGEAAQRLCEGLAARRLLLAPRLPEHPTLRDAQGGPGRPVRQVERRGELV